MFFPRIGGKPSPSHEIRRWRLSKKANRVDPEYGADNITTTCMKYSSPFTYLFRLSVDRLFCVGRACLKCSGKEVTRSPLMKALLDDRLIEFSSDERMPSLVGMISIIAYKERGVVRKNTLESWQQVQASNMKSCTHRSN